MFAVLTPAETRHEGSVARVDEDRIHRAIGIAANALAKVACLTLVATVAIITIIAMRTVAYGLGHQHIPVFHDLLTTLGLI